MSDKNTKENLLEKLNSEKTRIRKKAIKKIPLEEDMDIINKLILIVQIDEKEVVRKEAYYALAKIYIKDNLLLSKIITILQNGCINEPKENMRKIASKALQIRNRIIKN